MVNAFKRQTIQLQAANKKTNKVATRRDTLEKNILTMLEISKIQTLK